MDYPCTNDGNEKLCKQLQPFAVLTSCSYWEALYSRPSLSGTRSYICCNATSML